MSTPKEIWDRYERNIDRIRANLPAQDASDYRAAMRWLTENPETPETSDEDNAISLLAISTMTRIENKAAGKAEVAFSWPSEIGGEG